jgi:hypothetical protein
VLVTEGFRTGKAQDAFWKGRVNWRADVPARVRDVVQRSGTQRSGVARSRSIAITQAGLGEFSFETDRGPQALAAWWIQGPDTLGPIWVLDPAIERWAPADGAGGTPPGPPTRYPPLWSPIEIDAGGKEITFSWQQETLAGEPIVRVDEIATETAVSLAVIVEPIPEEPPEEPGIITGHTLMAIPRRITAWLEEPLGDRVFVGLHGEAIEILPIGSTSQRPSPAPGSARTPEAPGPAPWLKKPGHPDETE